MYEHQCLGVKMEALSNPQALMGLLDQQKNVGDWDFLAMVPMPGSGIVGGRPDQLGLIFRRQKPAAQPGVDTVGKPFFDPSQVAPVQGN